MATRFEEFGTQFFKKDGLTPNNGGQLFFYTTATTTKKSIFNGSDGSTEIANPVILDSAGRLPSDVWLDGTYKLVTAEAPNSVTGLFITIATYDPIGGTTAGQWELIDLTFSYSINEIARASDGLFYKSRINNNLNNDPAGFANTASWEHINFTLATVLHSGGGTLTAQVVNVITDGSTYTLPAANALGVSEDLIVDIPDRYKAFTPTIQRAGSDTITYSGGTDTEVLFNTLSLQSPEIDKLFIQ